MLNWQTKHISTVVDVVRTATDTPNFVFILLQLYHAFLLHFKAFLEFTPGHFLCFVGLLTVTESCLALLRRVGRYVESFREGFACDESRSAKELLVVDTNMGSVKSITAGKPEGSWTLLGIQQDFLMASCSSPNCPPSLKVGVLPPTENELGLQWISVEEASGLPNMEWKILTVHPPVSEETSPYGKGIAGWRLSPAS
ncbi:hypothetical protein JD844_012521 [Phrynosoma platyrhinos]|uniref:Acylamino-acid-releasing enzyme N-terminal domain-containing protein n=1 Tax=Phrynosoma platyrhinos TaxID=52577 RepID=A0ABQ7TLE9_PHRPL|nr:hypothetical protein JD844_012521 [Phrynosoma platyrhinos]